MSTDSATTDSDVPNRNYEWGDPKELPQGITVVEPDTDRVRFNGDVGYLGKGECVCVVSDVGPYLSEHAVKQIDVPPYYSRYDNWDTYVCETTVSAGGNNVGWGITTRRLEKAVRFATGGGRYRSDDLTVTAMDDGPVVLEYDGDTFIVSPTAIRRGHLPDDYEPSVHDVHGFAVPESDSTYRDTLARLLAHVDQSDVYDVTLRGYERLGNGKHVFRTDGQDLYVRGNDIRKATVPTDPTEVQQSYEIETENGETYEVSWDNIECNVGDTYSDWYHDTDGIVVGYQLRWEDPRRSSRANVSSTLKVDATYSVMRYVDNTDRRYSYDELKVKREKERLAEFDVDYNPLTDH